MTYRIAQTAILIIGAPCLWLWGAATYTVFMLAETWKSIVKVWK